MNRFRFTSNLTLKMVSSVLATQLLLINILYFGLGSVVEDGYQSQFVDYVRADAFNFAANISGGTELTSHLNTEAFEEAVLTGRTLFLRVLDKKGQITRVFGEISSAEKEFFEDYKFGNGESDVYHIAAPLYDSGGNYLGELQIGYDETDTREQIELAYQRCLLFAIAYALAAFAITSYFGLKMTRPIQILRELTRLIAHGQYQTVVSVNTNILEIKKLANSIEFMREELVAQSDSMQHLALHDSLTGLPNRVLLQDRISQTVNCRLRGSEPFVLAVIDLDRFKEINDSFGHLVGDNVLKQASTRLTNALRKSDTVARLGGDEFAIFLPETAIYIASLLAEKMVAELRRPFACEGHSVSIGASIGLACFPEHGTNYDQLLQRADVAMYAAKRSGSDIELYQDTFDQDALARLTLASDLQDAIEQQQLFACYQPKVDQLTDNVIGVELLARWQHPEKGLIPPNEFVGSAERGGLISQLTQWVLREGIKQAAIWHRQGLNIPVAINLSPRNLTEDGFDKSILALLNEYSLPASLLEFEITESSVFADPLRAQEILESLASTGINIAIDDFGTGYSSLVQLKRMPVSVLKIDQSFIRDMDTDASDAAIVSATIFMAHELGMKVVAEGVENSATVEKLRQLDCDIIQGYFFAMPMRATEFESWLENRKPPLKLSMDR